jgi:hypothetical protein
MDLVYIFLLTSSLLLLDTVRKVMFRPVQPTGGEYPQYPLSDAWSKITARLHWNGNADARRKKGGGAGAGTGAGSIGASGGGVGGAASGERSALMTSMEEDEAMIV